MNEVLQIGHYGLPALWTVILAMVYKTLAIPDRLKPWIPIMLSVALSLVALQYAGKPWEFKVVVDYITYGIMMGAATVGVYEASRTIYRPIE